MAAKKSLEQWRTQVEGILLNIQQNVINLGGCLWHARKELTKDEYDQLLKHVGKYALKEADIKAAIAAYLHENPQEGDPSEHRINPKLVFHGAKNSKILFMDKHDQGRLLSGEKFQVVMPNGKADKPKTWEELNDVQRNTLVGKGGQILTVQEQMADRYTKKNTAIYPAGCLSVMKDEVVLASRDKTMQLRVSFTELARWLEEEGGVDKMEAALQEVHEGTLAVG